MKLPPTPADRTQRNLIERFLLSVTAYVLCVAIAWVAKLTGLTQLDHLTLAISTLVILAYVVGVYFIYRSGLNRRIDDSLLTRLQMLVAVGWISFFLWNTEQLRGAMLIIYLFVAMFSFFTLSPRQTAGVGLVISVVYGSIIALDWWRDTPGFNLVVNAVQWGILSSALLWLFSISLYLNAVRAKMRRSTDLVRAQSSELQRANRQLEAAMAQLNHQATTDELTGLSNRRHFLSTVNMHIERSRENRFGFGLCVLDLDHFKHINDTFGHLIGDRVLQAFADVMRTNMRTYDFLARLGGEEFTLIVTRGDETVTRRCAERLRQAVADANFSNLIDGLELTVSIGATVFSDGDTLVTAMTRADAALYDAKRAGRNMCIVKLSDTDTSRRPGQT